MRRVAIVALAVLIPAGVYAQSPEAPAQVQVPPAAPPPQAPVQPAPVQPAAAAPAPVDPVAAAAAVDPTYTIGPDDVLAILFWRDKDTSTEVIVRPDGKITLPLLNDIQAAGLTPDQLRGAIQKTSEKYFQEPNVSVVVKAVNSRKVYVTGAVGRPGPYPLTSRTTVLQMLAQAGGLGDFAKRDKIAVLRTENGETKRYPFNYKDVIDGKKLEQNIELRPGDTLIVP
jgi:polysaccharide export outer membrane protein